MADKKDDKDAWIRIQQKTFTKWMNSHLNKRGLKIESLADDLEDGLKLIAFFEVISPDSHFPKYEKNPKLRIQKAQNIEMILKFVQSKGIRLLNVGATDIMDHNLKIILGFVWMIICKWSIDDISEEELSAKDALLLWVKKRTKGYKDVEVQNFHTSWKDGLAFNALLHSFRPDLIPFDTLSKDGAMDNLTLAFDVAEKKLNVPSLLDPIDIVDSVKPDERSIMTYVAQLYHLFAGSRKTEIAGRRVGRLVDQTAQNDQLRAEYNNLAEKFIQWCNGKIPAFEDRQTEDTIEDLKTKIKAMGDYKGGEKVDKNADKVKLEGLFNALAMKLRAAGRPPFQPPAGFALSDVDDKWTKVGDEERKRNEWLARELARLQQLQYLLNRFEQKASALEAWIAAKTDFLKTVESVETLKEAQTKLKLTEAFVDEYKASQSRLKQVKDLGAEVITLAGGNQEIVDKTKARVESIESNWGGLQGHYDAKLADLKEKLAREERKETLRIEFAKHAQAYLTWTKDLVENNGATDFGDSLEAVEAHQATLEKEDAENQSASEAKKAELDGLWQQMQELGVKDNRYTSITNTDVASFHNNVLESAQKRRDAYNAELERQRAMEAKRKEFAALAQKFVDDLATRRQSIADLNVEPDPDALIAKIQEAYAEGAAEQQGLDALLALHIAMGQMGITENKHTEFTLPVLTVRRDQFATHIKNTIQGLHDEKELKEDYNSRAKALLAWIAETTPTLKKTFDNTFEGARKVNAEWNGYRSGASSEKAVDQQNLKALYQTILETLKSNNRPVEFTPPSGLALSDVDAAFDAFHATEKEVEAEIKAELSRQEKLAKLVRTFNADAEELEQFLTTTEAFYNAREQIDTLNGARLHKRLLQLTNDEVESQKSRLEALEALRQQIAELNYHDLSTVAGRADALAERWGALAGLSGAKGEALGESVKVEEAKEALRTSLAQAIQAFVRFARDAVETAKDHNFGNSLDAVVNFKQKLDESDAEVSAKVAEKKAAVDKVWADIEAQQVSEPYKHSKQQLPDVEALQKGVETALGERRTAYDAELQKQQNNDAKMREFGAKAKEFIDFLAGDKKKVDSAEGEIDQKVAAIQGVHQEGAPGKQQLDALSALNVELQQLGIFSNPHTQFNQQALNTRNDQFNAYVKNKITGLLEEKERNERAAQQKAELEQREKLESLQIDFNLKAQAISAFLESADDIHADPPTAKNLEEANKLQEAYNTFSQQFPEQQAAFDALTALSEEMKAAGLNPAIAEITTRWGATLKVSEDRKAALAAEVEKQTSNDALCKEVAGLATGFREWLNQQKSASIGGGELEEQIKALSTFLESLQEGNGKLDALHAGEQKVSDAQIVDNPYTDLDGQALSKEFKEFVDATRKRREVLEKDLLMKKAGDITPEQLQEFREMFQHFDKGNKGALVRLEFKGALQSLGEDVADAALDTLMKELDQDGDQKISFEEFTSYMKKRLADTDSQEQILESFKELAGDKAFVTEDDLRRSGMDNEKVAYLIANMPKNENGFDYVAWVSQAYSR